jgi:hypothetical protein
MKFSFRHVFNLVVVVLLSIYVTTAMGYNPQARLMPLAVSVPILVLAVWQTIHDFKRKRGDKARTEETSSGHATSAPGGRFAKEWRVFAWIVGLFVSVYLFGFVFTTFVFTLLSLKVRSHFSWKASLGVSIGCLVFLRIVMIYGLQVDLYGGSVTLLLRKTFYGY